MYMYLIIFAIILCAIHIIFNYNERAQLLRKIPGPKSDFIVGNGFQIILSAVEIMKLGRRWSSEWKGIFSCWSFPFGAVIVYNPEDIEKVISSTKFNDKCSFYSILQPWLRTGLLISSGEKWQHRRKLLTPAFHFNILRQFFVILQENSQRLVESLGKSAGEPVDIVPVLSEFTLNSICDRYMLFLTGHCEGDKWRPMFAERRSAGRDKDFNDFLQPPISRKIFLLGIETAMGTQLSETTTAEAKSYKKAIYDLIKILIYRFLRIHLYVDTLFYLTTAGKSMKKYLDIVHSFTERVIKDRREYVDTYGVPLANDDVDLDDVAYKKKRKTAMLDLLLLAEKDGHIDNAGIQEEVDTFMFEGHDTTASGLTFCLIALANNREIQDKIYKELQEIMGDSTRPASLDDLPKMKYLECCIKESLRMYPPVHFISRQLNEPVTLSGYSVPANIFCHISIIDLHRSPHVFKDPLVFDPDRFLPENCIGRHPYAHIPFSAGPRNCIGQKFAMMEMKLAIAEILKKFVLLPVTHTEDIVFTADLVLRNAGPLYVNFVQR